MKFDVGAFKKICREIEISVNSEINNGNFT
jgi:hypothetical protein